MKRIYITIAVVLFAAVLHAQEQPAGKKSTVVKAAEKANQQSRKISDASGQVANEAQQVAGNMQTAVSNVKSVIKIFEPILRFRLKKKESNTVSNTDTANAVVVTTTEVNVAANPAPAVISTYDNPSVYVTPADIAQGVPMVTESPVYNADGSANLGSQNNTSYGCYLDISKGAVMDDIDAAGRSGSIDLIFTATSAFNEQLPMYAFLTPSYAKHDAFAYNFFKGTKYKDKNIPPASWEQVNESEVAMTALTAQQFEKIRDNNQLLAVIKQVRGFGQKVESRSKLDGKVIAVKTVMGGRTAYGLIHIVNHYGTTGENGYLKIRIKITGLDANGDGIPDGGQYN
ncbi:MAG: hypothetical protein U0V75_03640 [Ferruginibacter sp.]